MSDKTAMNILIEKIKAKADSIPMNTAVNRYQKGAYVDCLVMAKELLPDEEQQIIDAILAFTGLNHASPTDDTNMKAAQDYYNKKYKK